MRFRCVFTILWFFKLEKILRLFFLYFLKLWCFADVISFLKYFNFQQEELIISPYIYSDIGLF